MGTNGVVGAVAALAGAGLLRWLPVRGRSDDLTAAGLAGVRGGPRAALVAAVVELHLAGVLDVDRRGRLRRVVHNSPGRDGTPLHRAAWAAFGRTLSWADAATAPPVRRAREELRVDLVRRGLRCGRVRLAAAHLLTVTAGVAAALAEARGAGGAGLPVAALALGFLCTPARTLAGHRLLRGLRRRHPLPGAAGLAAAGAAAPGPGETALLVALHGRRALRRLLPDVAARAALLGGRAAREAVARTGGGPHEGSGAALSGGDGP
ncbi:TIGR04222 domain-containing membrane protein [Kitasatospora sp. NPDC093806]|uniref:TIGR04222 domain-containing membrane protein n=1 Tax=Kitasatospora sp. NPDC093806 TaxID=3155075 RepID=UPI00341603B3